ncbi:hypothetical protein HF086_013844 [Spodoptera exigua]|uniref:DNA mismatch repair protein MutS core domain-containing protein n=1 Tax=Spodoptera exigua TaxID=7107 RepID=A0A922MFU6_SPOEX|nr:hypothetical protein HF086_013844 [Spodoptera exigua]
MSEVSKLTNHICDKIELLKNIIYFRNEDQTTTGQQESSEESDTEEVTSLLLFRRGCWWRTAGQASWVRPTAPCKRARHSNDRRGHVPRAASVQCGGAPERLQARSARLQQRGTQPLPAVQPLRFQVRPATDEGILTKIKALSAKPYQWKSLYNTLYNAVLICEMCESTGKVSKFLEQLACFDNSKLYEMALYMNRIIDFDLSKTEGKFTVKPGVDPELDMKKQTMASLHGLMSETAKVEMERLPTYIQECSMLYMPHLGYLLGVKIWDDNLTAEDKELPNMKFMFQNNDYIHYKSKGCEELDVMIGDTYPEIVAHETRIMMRLTAVMLEHLHTLTALVDKCAELDCLIAISKVCKEFNYVRPTLSKEKIISIKAGRHPLYMLTCDSFVPNDVESSLQAGCRFEYVIQDGEPVFLFRVCEGGATSSFALHVAAAAGLGPATVARAKLVMGSVMVIILMANYIK